MIRCICGLIVTLALSACSAIGGQDTVGTLQAQNQAILDSATMIAQTAQAQQALVVATAVGVQTLVIERNSINQQLLATVRAFESPSGPVIAVEQAQPAQSMATQPAGALAAATPPAPDAAQTPEATLMPTLTPLSQARGTMEFVDVVTTNAIRDSDGCADGSQRQFAEGISRIYVVARALNLRGGTQIAANWFYEGKSLTIDRWTAPEDADELCVWFYVDADTVEFLPGNWVVQLTVDGQTLDPADFTIIASGDDGTS